MAKVTYFWGLKQTEENFQFHNSSGLDRKASYIRAVYRKNKAWQASFLLLIIFEEFRSLSPHAGSSSARHRPFFLYYHVESRLVGCVRLC